MSAGEGRTVAELLDDSDGWRVRRCLICPLTGRLGWCADGRSCCSPQLSCGPFLRLTRLCRAMVIRSASWQGRSWRSPDRHRSSRGGGGVNQQETALEPRPSARSRSVALGRGARNCARIPTRNGAVSCTTAAPLTLWIGQVTDLMQQLDPRSGQLSYPRPLVCSQRADGIT